MGLKKNISLAIVGSRTFDNYDDVKAVIKVITDANDFNITEIVSGGARGADTFGEQYAKENEIKLTVFPAEWKKYGKKAGFLRNLKIIANCDVCVCFWDGESHGTEHDIQLCEEINKPCYVWYYKEEKLELICDDINPSAEDNIYK